MAITATLVGSLGGASIGSQAVSFNITSAGSGTLHDVGTIPVPSGGDYRVVLVGAVTGVSVAGASVLPDMLFNGTDVAADFLSGPFGTDKVITGGGTVTVQVRTNSSSTNYSPTFAGTAYWWPET